MGALFIGVVLAFPNGLAGLYQTYVMPLEEKIFKRNKGPKLDARPVDKIAEPKPTADKADDFDPMIEAYSPEKS